MALMSSEVYEALVEIGIPADKATKAATALATPNRELADLRSDVSLVKWMLGVNTTLVLIVLGKVVFFMP